MNCSPYCNQPRFISLEFISNHEIVGNCVLGLNIGQSRIDMRIVLSGEGPRIKNTDGFVLFVRSFVRSSRHFYRNEKETKDERRRMLWNSRLRFRYKLFSCKKRGACVRGVSSQRLMSPSRSANWPDALLVLDSGARLTLFAQIPR